MSLAAAMLTLAMFQSPSAPRPDFRVLLVGLGPYDKQPGLDLIALDGPNDCKAIRKALETYYNLTDANFHELGGVDSSGHPNPAATGANIRNEFDAWLVKDAKPTDKLMFFYSGHGTLAFDSTHHVVSAIIPLDAKRTSDDSFADGTLITKEFFNKEIQKANGALVTIMSDSCNSGNLARGDVLSKGVRNKGISEADIAAAAAAPTNTDVDYQSAVLISAARTDREAYEDPKAKQGYLTTAFCKALMDRNAEATVKGPLTYKELQDRILANIAALPQPQAQFPQVQAKNMDAEVFGKGISSTEPYYRVVYGTYERPNGDTVDHAWIIDAGRVFNLTPGCTLSIFPTGADMSDPKAAKCTATVSESDAFQAIITPDGKGLDPNGSYRAKALDLTQDARVTVDIDALTSDPQYKDLANRVLQDMHSSASAPAQLPLATTDGDEAGFIKIIPPGPPSKGAYPSKPDEWIAAQKGGALFGERKVSDGDDGLQTWIENAIRDAGRKPALLQLGTRNPDYVVTLEFVPVTVKSQTDPTDGSHYETVTAMDASKATASPTANAASRFAIRVKATYADGSTASDDPTQSVDKPYVAVLDLEPDGHVTEAWPSKQFGSTNNENQRLLPDGKWHYLTGGNTYTSEADVADPTTLAKVIPWNFDETGQEVLKLLATDQPVDYSSLLTETRTLARGAGSTSPIGRLISALSQGRPVSRGMDSQTMKASKFAIVTSVISVQL